MNSVFEYDVLQSIRNKNNEIPFLTYYLQNPSYILTPLKVYMKLSNDGIQFLKRNKINNVLDVCLFYKDIKKIEYCFKIFKSNHNIHNFREYFWSHNQNYFRTFMEYLLYGTINSSLFYEIFRFIETQEFNIRIPLHYYDSSIYTGCIRNFCDIIYTIMKYNNSYYIEKLLLTITKTKNILKIDYMLTFLLSFDCNSYYLHIFMNYLGNTFYGSESQYNEYIPNSSFSLLHHIVNPLSISNTIKDIHNLNASYFNETSIFVKKKPIVFTSNYTKKIELLCKYCFYEYNELEVFEELLCNTYDEILAHFVILPDGSRLIEMLVPRLFDYIQQYNIQFFHLNQYNPYLDCARYGSFANFMTLWNIQHELRTSFLHEKIWYSDSESSEINLFTISFFNKDTRICNFLKEQQELRSLMKHKYLIDALEISIVSFIKNCKTWKSKKKAFDVLKKKIRCIMSFNDTNTFSLYNSILRISYKLYDYECFLLKMEDSKIKSMMNSLADFIIWFICEWKNTYSLQHPIQEIMNFHEATIGNSASTHVSYFLCSILNRIPSLLPRINKHLIHILNDIPDNHIIVRSSIQKLLILCYVLKKNEIIPFLNSIPNSSTHCLSWRWLSLLEIINFEISCIIVNGLITLKLTYNINRTEINEILNVFFNNIKQHLSKENFSSMKVEMLKKSFSIRDNEVSDCIIRYGVPILQNFIFSRNRMSYSILKKWYPVYSLFLKIIQKKQKHKIFNARKELYYELQHHFFVKTLNKQKINNDYNTIKYCFPEHITKERFITELTHNPMYCTIKADGERCFIDITKGVYPIVSRKNCYFFKNIAVECEKVIIQNKEIYMIYDYWDIILNKRLPLIKNIQLTSLIFNQTSFPSFLDDIQTISKRVKFIYPKPIYYIPQGKEGFDKLHKIYSCMELENYYPYDGLILITQNEKRWKLKPKEHMTIDVKINWDYKQIVSNENKQLTNVNVNWNNIIWKKNGIYRMYWNFYKKAWVIGEYRPEKHYANPNKIIEQLTNYHTDPFFLDDCKPYFESPYYHSISYNNVSKKIITKISCLLKKTNMGHKFTENSTILDLGCGYSVLDKAWEHYLYQHYTGIDADYQIIQSCKNINKKSTLHWGNSEFIYNYLKQEHKFKIIFILDSLQHILHNSYSSYEKYIEFFSLLVKNIKKGGYLFLRILDIEKLNLVLLGKNSFIENECYIKKINIETIIPNSFIQEYIKYYFSWVHRNPIIEPVFSKHSLLQHLEKIGLKNICSYSGSLRNTNKIKSVMECYTTYVFHYNPLLPISEC